ncbi:hypothetical protein D3C78_561850 [compost metagenome]
MRQVIGRQGRDDAQGKNAFQRLTARTGQGKNGVGFGKHMPCALDDLLSTGREGELLGVTVDQHLAKVVLQLAQLSGQRGLSDMAGVGGTAEVTVLRQCDEIAEFA